MRSTRADAAARRLLLAITRKLVAADFEDALQIAAAIACDADRIVTRNLRDFRGSPIQAVTPEAVLRSG